MEDLLIIVVIILFILPIALAFVQLSRKLKAENEQRIANEELFKDLQYQYKLFKDIISSSYALKACPKCFEKKMDILKVSETGQSVEYLCHHCEKGIVSRLLPGKDGKEAALKMGEIMQIHKELARNTDSDFKKREIDISLIVNSNVDISNGRVQRTPIPESVRNEVWRRDQGKCVDCGSKINLEFDHIIPFSKGGSNTARNLQLLCETCNRSKSNKI